MITIIHTTTTKNFDLITVVCTLDNWYEVYFNGLYVSQHINLQQAYNDVENQLSSVQT